jgi:hypothetical protein
MVPNRRKAQYRYIVGEFVGEQVLKANSQGGDVYLLDNQCLRKCYHEILASQLVFVRAKEVARPSSSMDQSTVEDFTAR